MANVERSGLIAFLLGDYEIAWNAVAALRGSAPRGNFTFGLLAMVLLEIACRDADHEWHKRATAALRKRDPRYFTPIPIKVPAPHFRLPGPSARGHTPLLHVLFDLVRNGFAHQYQQIVVTLSDSHTLHVTLTGATSSLDQVARAPRAPDHLRAEIDDSQNLWITLRTDLFSLDIRDSLREAGESRAPIQHFSSPVKGVASAASDES